MKARKIRVECRATVSVDISITDEEFKQLNAGDLQLEDVLDENVPYRALASDGEFEFTQWELLTSRGGKT